MLPVINVLGRDISLYSLCFFIGLVIGSLFAVYYFAKFNDINKEDVFYAILFGTIGIAVGAKLLYILTIIPGIIQSIQSIGFIKTIQAISQSGFVFYGGLIGGILGIVIYSKLFKVSAKKLLLTIVPVIPLVHSFGRIGCLMAGCCYGKEYQGFGSITFHNTLYAPTNIPLFPTQLVESICNLIIFIILFSTYKKFKGTYKTTGIYCILYSIVRFTLEFFRGDRARGFLFNLSTSQWFSILLIITGIALFIYENSKKETT